MNQSVKKWIRVGMSVIGILSAFWVVDGTLASRQLSEEVSREMAFKSRFNEEKIGSTCPDGKYATHLDCFKHEGGLKFDERASSLGLILRQSVGVMLAIRDKTQKRLTDAEATLAIADLQVHYLEQLDQLPENSKFSLRFPVQVETLARINFLDHSSKRALKFIRDAESSRTVASTAPSPSNSDVLDARRAQLQNRLQSVQARLQKKYSPSWVSTAFEPLQNLFGPVMMVAATFLTEKENH
jgi:hypothetical protein